MANGLLSDHECQGCTYVSSVENIYVDPKIIKKASEKPIFIGRYTMPGWTGHLNFYISRCPECSNIITDHPRGYTSYGHQNGLYFFHCDSCKNNDGPFKVIIFDEDVYLREGWELPLKPFFTVKRVFAGLSLLFFILYILGN